MDENDKGYPPHWQGYVWRQFSGSLRWLQWADHITTCPSLCSLCCQVVAACDSWDIMLAVALSPTYLKYHKFELTKLGIFYNSPQRRNKLWYKIDKMYEIMPENDYKWALKRKRSRDISIFRINIERTLYSPSKEETLRIMSCFVEPSIFPRIENS